MSAQRASLDVRRPEWLLLAAVTFAIGLEAFQEAGDLHRPVWYVIPGGDVFVATNPSRELARRSRASSVTSRQPRIRATAT